MIGQSTGPSIGQPARPFGVPLDGRPDGGLGGPTRATEPSLGALFGELARETSTLVRQEVELAKTEITAKAAQASEDAMMIGLGSAIFYGGGLFFLGGIVMLLGLFLPLWLSSVLVGLVVGGGGYAMALKAKTHLKNSSVAPTETIQTLREDGMWAKGQLR